MNVKDTGWGVNERLKKFLAVATRVVFGFRILEAGLPSREVEASALETPLVSQRPGKVAETSCVLGSKPAQHE